MKCVILLAFLLTACTITVRPLPKHVVNHPHRAQTYQPRAKTKLAPKLILVDSNWIENYKAEEQKHAYTIPADMEIKISGVKFLVPQACLDHFSDMTHARSTP